MWRWCLKLPAGSSWRSIILVNLNGRWARVVKEQKSSGSNPLSGPTGRGRPGLWINERVLSLISFSPGTWWQGKKRKKSQITETQEVEILNAGYQDSKQVQRYWPSRREGCPFILCMFLYWMWGWGCNSGARGELAILPVEVRMPLVRKETSKNLVFHIRTETSSVLLTAMSLHQVQCLGWSR